MGYGYKGMNNTDDGIVTVMSYDEFANIQDKMEQLNAMYFQEMYEKLEGTFAGINTTLSANREEIKDMAFKVQNEDL